MKPVEDPIDKDKLFNFPFLMLCISSVLFMMSFSMIMPELPGIVENMGGSEYFGYIFGLFTISAGLSRFWSGRFADIIGRRKIIIFGTLVTAICGALYIFTTTLASFFILRFIHGLSTGWRPTGSTAYVIDVIPAHRMGEGMGFLGMAGATGMAMGPVIGSILQEDVSYEAMFIISSVVGLISLLLSLTLPESLKETRKLTKADFNIFKGKTLDFSTLAPSIVTLLDTFSFGVIITLSPKLMSL
ncbi:MAG: MFS transporter, partial [Saprospiraceae bacterium]